MKATELPNFYSTTPLAEDFMSWTGKNKAAKKGFPVVVTSYEIVMADLKFLQQFGWKYIIVDEGHRLKNWNCKLLRELRTLEAGNKMILSGAVPALTSTCSLTITACSVA